MAAVAKAVALNLGLVSCSVAVHGALEPAPKNVTVCTGIDGAEHDPTRIHMKRFCAQCGEVPYDQIRKAREVPDGLVLLTDEDLEEVKADATAFKARMDLTPHPVEQVEVGTAPGDKAYYLVPNAGGEGVYAVFTRLVENHPELAFLTRFTPRSNMGVFQLRVHDGALFLQERIQGDKIKPAPAFTLPDAEQQWLTMAEQVLTLPGIVSDFDLATYRNTAEDKLREIVSARTAVQEAVTALEGGSSPTPTDPMAALQAMLDAAKDQAKTPRKRAAKKAVAR